MSDSTAAWVFPGQGSQYAGMGKELAATDADASAFLQAADAALGFSLTDLMFAGGAEALVPTPIQQPAILALSVAYLDVLRKHEQLPVPAYVAGHSLGEYSALVAAGSLDPLDAVTLVRKRGELMQEHGAGSMAALIGLDEPAVEAIASESGVEIANYNSPGQITVSGRTPEVERAIALAKGRGAKRAIMLGVSGAFHSSLMAPVVDGMRPLIEQTEVRAARVPLVTNVTAQPITHPDDIRQELLDQICASVRWTDVVRFLTDHGVTTFVEIGPGKVLSGLIARIARGSATMQADAMVQAITVA
jgi:[acyl-carrier-protein] S-malonyltransferase